MLTGLSQVLYATDGLSQIMYAYRIVWLMIGGLSHMVYAYRIVWFITSGAGYVVTPSVHPKWRILVGIV